MKSDFEHSTQHQDETPIRPSAPAPRSVLTLDVALYQHYLDDSDLTDDQKREFLGVLWSIIIGFVDLGFSVEPVQQAQPDVGQISTDEKSGGKGHVLLSSGLTPDHREKTKRLSDEVKTSTLKGRAYE